MLQTEPLFDRPLGKRDQKPALENEIGDDGHTERHRQDDRPAVFAQPSHEPSDEDDRGDIEPGEWHDADIDRGWNDNAHDLAKLSPFGEQLVIVLAQSVPQVYGAGSDDEESDIERKEAGTRAFGAPVDPRLEAAEDHDHSEQSDQ